MASVTVDSDSGYVVVAFPNHISNGVQKAVYPFVWLRDNCQCQECFDSKSKDRQFMLRHLDPQIQPASVELIGEAEISVTWPDQHCSRYQLEWLWQHRFERQCWDTHDRMMSLPERLWRAVDIKDNMPQVKYDSLIGDDKGLFDWLIYLEIYGICLITEAPTKVGVLHDIGARISHLTGCHYGEIAAVKINLTSSNLAYNSKTLGLHTDFPNLEYSPEMQMLHCIQQAKMEGGDTTVVDAFQVANDMKRDNENCFQTLCDIPVNFEDAGEFNYVFHTQSKKPTFECDKSGKLVKVMYSNTHRDSLLAVPVEKVKPFYTALTLFERMINDPTYCIRHKLKPGEIMCVDNFRVMHGREAFTETVAGERHLEVGYIGWDYLKSKRRVLQNKLAISQEMLEKYYE